MESARKPDAGCTLRCAIDVSEPGADSGRAALARAQHRREHSDLQLSRTIILRSLPVKEPARLVLLGEGNEGGVTDRYGSTTLYSYPFYRQFQQKNAVFSDVAAIFSMSGNIHATIDGRDATELMHAQIVSGTYFPTLGVQPLIGRSLTDDDDNSEGDHPVAVISYAWWKRGLAGDPAVLNRKIKLGTIMFQIVGVAPPEFFGTSVGEAPDIWVPMSMMKSIPGGWNGYKNNFFQASYLMGHVRIWLNLISKAFPPITSFLRYVRAVSRSLFWRPGILLCVSRTITLRSQILGMTFQHVKSSS